MGILVGLFDTWQHTSNHSYNKTIIMGIKSRKKERW